MYLKGIPHSRLNQPLPEPAWGIFRKDLGLHNAVLHGWSLRIRTANMTDWSNTFVLHWNQSVYDRDMAYRHWLNTTLPFVLFPRGSSMTSRLRWWGRQLQQRMQSTSCRSTRSPSRYGPSRCCTDFKPFHNTTLRQKVRLKRSKAKSLY